ncbi:LuxR C-terminal-related transcriptional regulator [Pseudanabaena sp. FACHB-2040]|uniref:LuxR C-terminal-related transcriptional regulator n=1 Tax=Pseudanabaena sp. FACHB-2040 TaxID=2692859 RepID=UPI0016842256|nr:GAF domain-containing protein [Pseudanabaena sp. FACHB-2040]
MLDSTRLLFDLQQVGQIAQAISGCLDAGAIATQVTNALVDQFDCVFARIWLVEPDQQTLRLVASSGLYTHTDGSFARVPMGAYKVGKIAQNRVPFLSNQLPEESWVKDRDWAIANNIQGFAGYPLAVKDRVIGVLATFSHYPLAPEFLEVLQVLCMTTTIALDAALQAQRSLQVLQNSRPVGSAAALPLSDQLAAVLTSTRLMLMGTEQSLSPCVVHVFLRAAEVLNQLGCNYCRLTYGDQSANLEALIALTVSGLPTDTAQTAPALTPPQFLELQWMATCLGGTLELQVGTQRRALQCLLQLPYVNPFPQAIPLTPVQTTADPLQAAPPEIEDSSQRLSEREREIIKLLAQGMRDRDIARELHISESTVKFHINNSAAKLSAKNRYQTVYQAAIRGWV